MMTISANSLVMIIGHKEPAFMDDTAESVVHYNPSSSSIVVFAVDNNVEAGQYLVDKYGADRVYVTPEKNGWGRGILRTIVHAIDYFSERVHFNHLFTLDSDALCVGPFIDRMTDRIHHTSILFVGTTWQSPDFDHQYHYDLRDSGFMGDYPFEFKTELVAGPCMLWTNHCLEFMRKVNLLPGSEFDKVYPNIQFAHDQISTYLHSSQIGFIRDCSDIMELRWREALPTEYVELWGDVPIVYDQTAIIHPTVSDVYHEANCRAYFRNRRGQLI